MRNLEHSLGCIGFISAGFTPFANPRPVATAARAGLTRIPTEREGFFLSRISTNQKRGPSLDHSTNPPRI